MTKLKSFVVFLAVFIPSILYADSQTKMVLVDCDGSVSKINLLKEQRQTDRNKYIGDVQRGSFFLGDLYAFDLNKELIITNIDTLDSKQTYDFEKLFNDSLNPWRVLYVNSEIIVISIYEYDETKPIPEKREYRLFTFNRKTSTIEEITIPNGDNDFVSIFKNKIYYSNSDGVICSFSREYIKKFGIIGKYPTISPDGAKIAYIAKDNFCVAVKIYDLTDKQTITVLRKYGKNTIFPLIRWSNDSKLIAVSDYSDISAKTLYVINLFKKEISFEIDKCHACNWLFVGE